MNSSNHFILGLFVLVSLGILGYFTIGHSDFSLFGEVQQIVVQFPEADGLGEGDAVLVAGVRWGKVTTITYHPEERDLQKRITVLVSLDRPIELREGHEIEIRDATLLGGKRLTIDPGAPGGRVLPMDSVFQGTLQLNVIEAAGEIITDNAEAFGETIEGLNELVGGVRRGKGTVGLLFTDKSLAEDVGRAVIGIADTADNLSELSGSLRRGEGTLGRLIVSDELYVTVKQATDSLNGLLADAEVIVRDARAGKGTLGMLMTDEEVSADVKGALADLHGILGRANSGQGTLGKFLVEDTIALDVETVMGRLARGEGTLGHLLADDEVYEDITAIAGDLADVVATVREGRGTLGKLIMEEELYFEILKAVGLLTRSLEEYREAAPISTLTGVIFGAL